MEGKKGGEGIPRAGLACKLGNPKCRVTYSKMVFDARKYCHTIFLCRVSHFRRKLKAKMLRSPPWIGQASLTEGGNFRASATVPSGPNPKFAAPRALDASLRVL